MLQETEVLLWFPHSFPHLIDLISSVYFYEAGKMWIVFTETVGMVSVGDLMKCGSIDSGSFSMYCYLTENSQPSFALGLTLKGYFRAQSCISNFLLPVYPCQSCSGGGNQG